MLAVVHHQEELPIGQVGGEDGGERDAVARTEAPQLGDLGDDEIRVGDRRELDHPDAVAVVVGQVGRDLDRQSGLPGPAGARERDESRLPGEGGDLPDLTLAADERRELRRQVDAGRVDGVEVVGDLGQQWMTELEQVHGPLDVLERVDATVEELAPGREVRSHEPGCDVGDEDLAGVGRGHHAGALVDLGSEVVARPLLGSPGVDAHAHPDRRSLPRFGREFQLHPEGRLDGVGRSGERGTERVAGDGEDVAAPVGDRRPHDPVVDGEAGTHARLVGVPEPRRPGDVREEE